MSAGLVELVATLGEPRVLVVGDLILDRYIFGNADRISPEAPVLVLHADQQEERLGGAAGVAAMLRALGARVALAGLLGPDPAGQRCRALLAAQGIDQALVRDDPKRPTTIKERYIGRAQHRHLQQILRVDYEARAAMAPGVADDLADQLRGQLGNCDIVLVSDYDKGVCGPLLERQLLANCRARGLRTLVDPYFGSDYQARYRGSNLLKPNRREAERATGITIGDLDAAFAAAASLRQDLDLEIGLVTLDRDGLVLVDGAGQRQHFPVRARQVYDITGAGDMVLAVLGLVLAAGHGFAAAAALANVAAALQVERFGAATIGRQELLQELQRQAGSVIKVLDPEPLLEALLFHRQAGRKIAFTNGCFDLVHVGHIHCLRQARAQGDLLVVGLNSDLSVRKLGKGPGRPIHDQARRAEVLAALECVDYVCAFDEETPYELIRQVRPDILVKGADYKPEQIAGKDFVESYGGRLHLVSLVPGQSSTAVAQKLKGIEPTPA